MTNIEEINEIYEAKILEPFFESARVMLRKNGISDYTSVYDFHVVRIRQFTKHIARISPTTSEVDLFQTLSNRLAVALADEIKEITKFIPTIPNNQIKA